MSRDPSDSQPQAVLHRSQCCSFAPAQEDAVCIPARQSRFQLALELSTDFLPVSGFPLTFRGLSLKHCEAQLVPHAEQPSPCSYLNLKNISGASQVGCSERKMKQMWVRESNNTTLDLVDRWILNVPEAPPSICKYQSFTYVCLVIVLFRVGGGFLFRCSLLPQNLL